MAKKELPKAQLAGIVKGIVKGYQGAKAGVKLASKIKTRAKNIKAIGVTKKADAIAEAEKKAARLQKAADTRAVNKAAKARPASDTKKVISKTETEIPPIPKGKEPFVKSKNRQRLENASGKAVGALTYGTANITKKALKNRNVQAALIGTGIGLGVYRLLEGKRPVKIKKIKKK
jgi:uncharacterized membrane protein